MSTSVFRQVLPASPSSVNGVGREEVLGRHLNGCSSQKAYECLLKLFLWWLIIKKVALFFPFFLNFKCVVLKNAETAVWCQLPFPWLVLRQQLLTHHYFGTTSANVKTTKRQKKDSVKTDFDLLTATHTFGPSPSSVWMTNSSDLPGLTRPVPARPLLPESFFLDLIILI